MSGEGNTRGRAGARVHVAGNTVLDLLLRDASPEETTAGEGWRASNVRFLERPVEAVLGGNGGATAYLLGRLGAAVSLNTRVGMDAPGRTVRGWLEEAGTAVVGPWTAATAVNVVMLTPEGGRRSFYYTGEKVAWRASLDAGADWFFASGYGQVTAADLAELTAVFEAVRKQGTRVAFDPGPWFFAAAGRAEMEAAWREVDCLIGTEAELSTWHGGGDARDLVGRLLAEGPECAVVKRGGAGAAFGRVGEGPGVLATERIERANTVGAGDTFNAGLLFGLSRGDSLEEAVRAGLLLATQAVRGGRGVLGALDGA